MLTNKCHCSNFKWMLLITFILAVMVQILTNFSIFKKSRTLMTNNIFINGKNIKDQLVMGKYRNEFRNLVTQQVEISKPVTSPQSRVTSTIEVTVRGIPPHTTPNVTSTVKGEGLALCPVTPPGLVGPIKVDMNSMFWTDIAKRYPQVEKGGRWWPKDCKSRHRVAILIPYRNREPHLKVLLNNMHLFLQKQQLDYGIYVIEEAEPTTFNRGILVNIGFEEVLKKYPFQCFAFHDVDLLPENDKNIYSCPGQPRHMSANMDKFKYRLPYAAYFGGVSLLTTEQIRKINGFSNKFFGWGGEDDDLSFRVTDGGYHIIRYPADIARYKMIKHGSDKGNQVNPKRFALISKGRKRSKVEGLKTLKGTYKILKYEERSLYTWIKVEVDEQAVAKT